MKPKEISRLQLQEALASGRPPVILEALDETYYEKAHLPGALVLPLSRLKEVARTRLGDKQAALVVYCASSTCSNSHLAAKALGDLGYEDVRVYAGGKADWIEAGLPVETGSRARGRGPVAEVAS